MTAAELAYLVPTEGSCSVKPLSDGRGKVWSLLNAKEKTLRPEGEDTSP